MNNKQNNAYNESGNYSEVYRSAKEITKKYLADILSFDEAKKQLNDIGVDLKSPSGFVKVVFGDCDFDLHDYNEYV